MSPPDADMAGLGEADDERRRAVLDALDGVLDPELDESVTAMGFVESVAFDGPDVDIVFRLPTFWCSANFAFLMAVDMRAAVGALPGVREARVRLVDHFAAGKINRGVAAGHGFAQVFEGEARSGVDDIRRVFREKAFLGRQEAVLRLLLDAWGAERAARATVADIEALAAERNGPFRPATLRYLTLRREMGGPAGDRDAAFTTLAGEPVGPSEMSAHLRSIRRVRGAAQANAEMCRIYLEARYDGMAPGTGSALEGARLAED